MFVKLSKKVSSIFLPRTIAYYVITIFLHFFPYALSSLVHKRSFATVAAK